MSATDEVIELLTDQSLRRTSASYSTARAALALAWLELGLRWLHEPRGFDKYSYQVGYEDAIEDVRFMATVPILELGLRWLHDRADAGYRAPCGCRRVCGITLHCDEHIRRQL